jgi:hypothetical protein
MTQGEAFWEGSPQVPMAFGEQLKGLVKAATCCISQTLQCWDDEMGDNLFIDQTPFILGQLYRHDQPPLRLTT